MSKRKIKKRYAGKKTRLIKLVSFIKKLTYDFSKRFGPEKKPEDLL